MHLGVAAVAALAGPALVAAYDDTSDGAAATRLAIGGIVMLATGLALRTRRKRLVIAPGCDHHVEIERDDAFLRVPVWAWGVVSLVLSAIFAVQARGGS